MPTLPNSTFTGPSAPPSQPSPPSSDVTRGEVEGSSDNNSPPTSVIQGETDNAKTFEWINSKTNNCVRSVSKEFLSHHEELNSEKFSPKYPAKSSADMGPSNGFHSLEEEVMFLRSLRLGGDGRTATNSSDGSSNDDNKADKKGNSNNNVPYDVLCRDLTQAKRQLLELHSLVSKIIISSYLN